VTTAAISDFVPLFEQQFVPLTMTVAEFTAGPSARVDLVDVVDLLPTLAALEGRAVRGGEERCHCVQDRICALGRRLWTEARTER